jgi:pimeloyl-ACP methyl ester carboxylesterase
MHAGKAGERLLASSDFAMLADWAFGGSVGVTPDLVAAYREDWSRPGAFHAMAEWYRANYPPDLLNPDLEFDLPPIEIPTRYLHAEHDLAVVPEMATGSGKWVDAEFDERIVPGTTHWMLHERPDEVAGLIDDWMRRP